MINLSPDDLNMDCTESPFIKTGNSKTLCNDVDTCQSLNEFLDTGYGVPKTLSFNISSNDDWMNTSICMKGMGVRERAEFQFRIMRFVMDEINKIKNAF